MPIDHKLLENLEAIKPKSIIYLFSGGKDSALALLKTRDTIKYYMKKSNTDVYIVHITIPGNTHPFNVYAAGAVMLYHEKVYGFKPVFLSSNRVFQEFVIRYGLQIGSRRWCYQLFKNKVIAEFEQTLAQPVIEIDGMKQSDSKHRQHLLKGELEEVVRKTNNFKFYALHPLWNYNGDPLKELENYHEFKPIVQLYKIFGDSLNCILCPYKKLKKYIKHNQVESLIFVKYFLDFAIRSNKYKKMFSIFANSSLERYFNSPT